VADSPLMQLRRSLDELAAEHVPFRYVGAGVTKEVDPDKEVPVGCRWCYPSDSDWPCCDRITLDEAFTALEYLEGQS
jgi:hypothetical protein